MPGRWGRSLGTLVLVALGAGAAVGSLGCLGNPHAKDATETKLPPLPPVAVDDATFARSLHQLLRDGGASRERSALLAGVVRRQLGHASELALHGQAERTAAAVVGALYLVRLGDGRPDMVDASAVAALDSATRSFSTRGDEGRALAMLRLAAAVLPAGSPESAEVKEHTAALERWMRETRTGAPMQRLATEMRAAIDLALVDSSPAALAAAVQAVEAWVERALAYNEAYHTAGVVPPRDEAVEAFRALRTGGMTLAALFLRHGLATEALDVLERRPGNAVTETALLAGVRRAANDDSARAWSALVEHYSLQPLTNEAGDSEPTLDGSLADAAIWGAALEAYRREPTSFQVGHLFASELVGLGLPEAAPLVLADGLGKAPPLVHLGGAMALVMDALNEELESEAPERARRIYAAAEPLLALADAATNKGGLKPSGAQLRQLMAGVEIRAGDVDAARPLLLRALADEPSVWGYTMLAMLERQTGELDAALEHAERAGELPDAKTLELDAADAKLLTFELLRDAGKTEGAEAALAHALEIALATRDKRLAAPAKVRAERLLARVLDGYGERVSAGRAIERALEIAGRHAAVLGRTMLDAIARALVYRDVAAARAALARGLDGQAEPADLVYGALWLMLLERELGAAPDGQVERVLGESGGAEGWTGQLARWGRDKLGDDGLRAAATSYVQKTEAEFYIAMRARAAGNRAADAPLRAVAQNPLIDLAEVQIARDLFAPRMQAKIPERFRVP
ncbi:MAG: hypothetical protein HY908_01795 [Myxococcales bacterium]|nr:hypothetical protein [Myxococcales bacterium]